MMMVKKIYATRAQTRAMALDHPIADPTGGPAYGELRAPLAAVATMALTAEAAFAGSVMAGIAFAGGAASLVGSLTGNKMLTKVGMVAGVVGGLGASGLLGESLQGATWGSTFGGAESAMGGATEALTASTAPGSQAPVQNGALIEAPAADLLRNGGEGFVAANAPSAAPPSVLNAPGGAANSLNAGPGGLSQSALNAANGSIDPLGSLIQSQGYTSFDPAYAAGVRPMTGTERLWQGAKDAGNGLMRFAKENPGGAMMLSNAASGVANWLSGAGDAELDAMEAQSNLYGAKADEIREKIAVERQRRKNLNDGWQQVNPNIQINPNAQVQMPWQTQQGPQPMQQYIPNPQAPGLINSVMVRR